MSSFGAVLDACVLYPMYLRDTLLRAAEAELYTVHWTSEILDEVHRNIVAGGHVNEYQARRLVEMMTLAFPEAEVTGYESLVASMLNHPKDRHVTAAAVASGAQVIVTDNLKDYPLGALDPYSLEAQSADAFLSTLFSLDNKAMAEVIVSQARDYVAPPMTVLETLNKLATHAPKFVDLLRDWFDRFPRNS